MKDLVVKEVDFQGNKIIAICEDGKIYVVVKRICENLGMDKSQSDYQIQKIQKDGLLEGACRNKHLKTNGGIQESLVMELDYLPAWLFKINPIKFDKDLKEKLMFYQLKAKDILADAFFGKREGESETIENDGKHDWAIERIRDRVDRAEYIEKNIVYLYQKLKEEYCKIEKDVKFKKELTWRNFWDFKKKSEYDVKKDPLPILVEAEIEEELAEKIKNSGIGNDEILEKVVKVLENKKTTNKE